MGSRFSSRRSRSPATASGEGTGSSATASSSLPKISKEGTGSSATASSSLPKISKEGIGSSTVSKEDIGSSKCYQPDSLPKVGAILISTSDATKPYKNLCTAFRVILFRPTTSAVGISEEPDDAQYIITAAHCFREIKWRERNPDAYYPKMTISGGHSARFLFCEGFSHFGDGYTEEEVMKSGCVRITKYWLPNLWSAKKFMRHELGSERIREIKDLPYSPDMELDHLSESFDFAVAKVTTKGDGYKVKGLWPRHIGDTLDRFMAKADCTTYGYPGGASKHKFTAYEVKDLIAKDHTFAFDEDVKLYNLCQDASGGASGGPVVCNGDVVALLLAVVKDDHSMSILGVLSLRKIRMMQEAVRGASIKGEAGMFLRKVPWEDASSVGNVHMFDGNSLYEMELVSISLLIMIIGCLFCVLCWLIGLLCGYFSHAFCTKQERVKTFDPESVCMI